MSIVKTLGFGITSSGAQYILMEYLDGPGLNALIKDRSPLLQGNQLTLIRQMADAIGVVHQAGFIHRDICPRNFICTPNSESVKLIDFGLTVPATKPFMAPGNRTGTPLYMSPEIVRRRPTDQRVDIFSLGVTFYCLVAFNHPWQGEILNGRAALQHDSSPPTDLLERCPNVDPRLARAVMNALNPKVDERTTSVEQFLSAISGVEKVFVD